MRRLLLALTAGVLAAMPAGAAGAADPPARVVEVQRRDLIAAVHIEPREPCRGQSVMVRVQLRPEAADAKVSIAGAAGNAAVLRFERRGVGRVGIVARDWQDGMQVERRRIRVRDCRIEEPRIEVEPIADSRVALRLRDANASSDVTGYRWLLGDGTFATTREPILVHDFPLSSQQRATASWIVEAVAVGGGTTAREHAATSPARAAVSIANPLWLATRRGPVQWLRTRVQPFAQHGAADEAPLASMEIESGGAASTLEGVTLRGFACADLDRALAAELPADALSQQTLQARGWTPLQVALPASLWSEPVCRVEIRVHGRSTTGRPTIAMGATELAPAVARRRVTDPALLQKLREAKARYGRAQISEQDLRLLAAQD